jgi:hypothetical protein
MSAGFRSRWLDWTPEYSEIPPTPPPTKPTKETFVGSVGAHPTRILKIQAPSADPALVVCYVCRGSDFWQGSGAVVCRRCHPPAPGAEVSGRVKIEHGAPAARGGR